MEIHILTRPNSPQYGSLDFGIVDFNPWIFRSQYRYTAFVGEYPAGSWEDRHNHFSSGKKMTEERVLWDAEFNERVTTYWLLNGAIILTVTVVGIVLVAIWFIIGGAVTHRYLKTYRCTLTNGTLKVGRGWLVEIEKTIPLDGITDLGLVQRPIMQLFDMEAAS